MRLRNWFLVLIVVCAIVHTASRRKPPRHRRTPAIQHLIATANAHLTRGEYSAARSLYSLGLARVSSDNYYDRASFLIGLGGCDAQTQQYQSALDAYARAERLAEEAGLTEHRIIIAANRASVYRKMGYLAPALASLEKIAQPLEIYQNPLYIAQAASLLRNLDFPRSLPLFRRAILKATEQGDDATAASAWLQLGAGLTVHGDLSGADRALTEALRLRIMLGNRQRQSCYFFLGHLRRIQKRTREAIVLLRQAETLAGTEGAHTPLPWVYHQLAKAYLDERDYAGAFAHFERAVRTARELRLQLLPADAFRMTAEATLQEIYEDYLEASLKYLERTQDSSIIHRMFNIAEESRVSLFEHALNTDRRLPPEYWELLARYERMLSASLDPAHSPAAVEAAARTRLTLNEMEARLGIETEQREFSHQIFEKPLAHTPLTGVRKRLNSGEALLSFHCGTRRSLMWAVTRGAIEVHRLPSRPILEAEIRRFRDSVIEHRKDAAAQGQALAQTLFGGLSPSVHAKAVWVVSPDGPLFELPVAAVPVPGRTDGVFIAQRHSLRIVPGASIRQTRASTSWTQRFAGLGDAIYNSADPRRRSAAGGGSGLELPRLPGSGREVEACAKAWQRNRQPLLLTGVSVSSSGLRSVLEQRPAILHFAGHVIPHPRLPDQVLMTFGLQAEGTMDVLGPAEISSTRLAPALITLSGCGSGQGEALPGLGLFGLSRAWLLAGAETVVASHWPIADDSGDLLSAMYRELANHAGPVTATAVATSLQRAQQRMLELGGWRADPAYWAAFAVFGKD